MGGKVTCTLGEVKNRADFIIYWGGNPAECHPRHFSKYTITQKGKFIPEGRKGRTMVLVDIREPEERVACGVIPGGVHAPRGMLEFYADATSPYHRPEFETGRRIILYCAFGGRSALAADALQRLGFEQVAHLEGGMKSWIAAGQPVESV